MVESGSLLRSCVGNCTEGSNPSLSAYLYLKVRGSSPLGYAISGEMREWLNRAASKAVVPLVGTEGSNPSLSVREREYSGVPPHSLVKVLQFWRDDRVVEGARLESV